MELRSLRRDRAARQGAELFLLERTFADCLDRLSLVRRRFGQALLLGCPDPDWPGRLSDFAAQVEVRDPGRLFAEAAGGATIVEDDWRPAPAAYDLILAIGTLDTVSDLPGALVALRRSMRPDGLFLGAMAGGDSLPQLRGAMRAADVISGNAVPHVHPRIEASALSPLLAKAGFHNPVVDIDRASVAYRLLPDLIADLRRMGATNVLAARSRKSLSKAEYALAATVFAEAGDGERTTETVEILHFACWTPSSETD